MLKPRRSACRLASGRTSDLTRPLLSCERRHALTRHGWSDWCSGCGPIGLITAAVSHAYSARKIIGFDINPARVEFAKKYMSPLTGKPIFDHVFLVDGLPSTPVGHQNGHGGDQAADEHHQTPGDCRWEWAKVRAAQWCEETGLVGEEGVDRVIEAAGAEDAMLHGIAFCKQGGVCEWDRLVVTDLH